jgi:drug/metabolite transporter (DMT)-like permease
VAAALALLSSVLWGGADFLGGLVSRRLPPVTVVVWSQACGLVAIAVVAIVTGAYAGPLGWLGWSIVAGLSGGIGLACFYTALAIGTMGVVSPIAALGAIIPVIAGLLLGDTPSILQYLGMALGLLGALAASGPELSAGARGRSVVLAAIAGIGFGMALLGINLGAQVNPVMTLVGMRSASVGSFLVVALVRRRGHPIAPSDFPVIASVGVGDVVANLTFAVATTIGMMSIVAVLGTLYPVVTVILGRIVLGERLVTVQKVGVGVAMGGVVLLAAG